MENEGIASHNQNLMLLVCTSGGCMMIISDSNGDDYIVV
jgi:hypothetical protein